MTAGKGNGASLTEDYVGLARYLAEAISQGEVPFDQATVELSGAATANERASLARAAVAVRERGDGPIAAELLMRAQVDRA
jgi:hypothetical protein